MPRSVCVHPDHQPGLPLALQCQGFLTQGALAVHLEIALSTVSNFFRGIPVSISKFEQICLALELEPRLLILPKVGSAGTHGQSLAIDLGNTPPTGQTEITFFAYDQAWVGRESLIQHLHQRLQGDCRLLLLTGLAGIGKTALAERLLAEHRRQDKDLFLLRENFEHQEQDFGSVAARLLQTCGEVVLPSDRQDASALGDRLIHRLQTHPYWLVLDSLEELLVGDDQTGWSTFKDPDFVQFFRRLLAIGSFQSRLILTSQEFPGQLGEVGTRYQTLWHHHCLSGLTAAEQLELFAATGLNTDSEFDYESILTRIGTAYEGHPLALRVIAGEIGSHPFYGQVNAYWQQYRQEIETVEQAIAVAQTGQMTGAEDQWRLDRFTRLLRQNVRSRLAKTIARLQVDVRTAYLLLCETSVYRCAVPEDWWLSHLDYWGCTDDSKQIALDALKERFLLEEWIHEGRYLLRQHNLIRSISLEQLKQLQPLPEAENG
jgi:hypothetical protein